MTNKDIMDFLSSCDQEMIKNYELIKLNPNSLYSYQLNISNIQIWHKIAKKIGMKKFMESMKNEK